MSNELGWRRYYNRLNWWEKFWVVATPARWAHFVGQVQQLELEAALAEANARVEEAEVRVANIQADAEVELKELYARVKALEGERDDLKRAFDLVLTRAEEAEDRESAERQRAERAEAALQTTKVLSAHIVVQDLYVAEIQEVIDAALTPATTPTKEEA